MVKKYVGPVPGSPGIRYRHKKDDPFTLRGYEVRYRDPGSVDRNGEPVVRGKTFRTLAEAKAFRTETASQIQGKTFISPTKQRETWGDVSRQWIEARRVKLRPRTIVGYENALGRWFGRWDKIAIGELTPEHVRSLIADVRSRGLAVETEHRIFNVASGVFKWARKQRHIHESPCDVVRDELRSLTAKEFQARALTSEQAEAIVNQISEGRNRLFALLLFWTGLRGGELAGLRVCNVDRLRNTIQVGDTIQDLNGVLSVGTTKTRKSKGRRVPIPKAIMDEVGAFIDASPAKRSNPEAFVFASNADFFNYANWSQRHWTPACKRAGFTRAHITRSGRKVEKPIFRPYDLRHTFASLRAQAGVKPHVLKEWMGHTSIETTMNIYTHVYEGDPTNDAIIERLYGASAPSPTPLDKEGEESA